MSQDQSGAPNGQGVSSYTLTAVVDETISHTDDMVLEMNQQECVPMFPASTLVDNTDIHQSNTNVVQQTYNTPYVSMPGKTGLEQSSYHAPVGQSPMQGATTQPPVTQGSSRAIDDGPPISYRKERVIQEIKRRKFDKKAKSKLFVGGLYSGADESFLQEKFKPYGELVDACIVYEKGTSNSRGFGYVTFANSEDAANAMKEVDGLRTNGRTLCVEYADDPKRNQRGPPPPHRRHRSRSPPPYPPRHYPPPPPRGYYYDEDRYRDRYASRERYRDPDAYYYERDRYERDRYERDRYERERYYMERRSRASDPYNAYYHRDYPPRDGYPPRDYRRDYPPPPRDDYDYRRSPPPRYAYRDRYGRDIEPPERPYNYRISDLDSARLRVNREEVRRVDDGRETSETQSQSDSDSSEDEKPEKRKKTKPRQVSAFPSAYLS